MATRAYLSIESDDQARVEVYENVAMYGGPRGTDAVLSETFPLTDDGKDYVMGAVPEQPFVDADAVLVGHGWKREGRWLIGDVVTGTYARVTRV